MIPFFYLFLLLFYHYVYNPSLTVSLFDRWLGELTLARIHTRAKDRNKEAPYLSYQRHMVNVLACGWIIYVDTSTHIHIHTHKKWDGGDDADTGCYALYACALCGTSAYVCLCILSLWKDAESQGPEEEWKCCHKSCTAAFVWRYALCLPRTRHAWISIYVFNVAVFNVNVAWMIQFLKVSMLILNVLQRF